MRKLTTLIILAVAFGFTACNNEQKTEEQIDSLNQSAADSLLNEALADTTVTDNVAVDSLAVDTVGQ